MVGWPWILVPMWCLEELVQVAGPGASRGTPLSPLRPAPGAPWPARVLPARGGFWLPLGRWVANRGGLGRGSLAGCLVSELQAASLVSSRRGGARAEW
jgi:hypothetical protein